MKLLVLYQAHNSAIDQPGYYQGFEQLVAEGRLDAHAAIPYYGVAHREGWDAMWAQAVHTAENMEADAVFLQFFHGHMSDPAPGIERLRRLPTAPAVFSSLGDPFGRWTNRIPRSFRIASRLSDLSFMTSMGYLAKQLESWGSHNLVLMPNGCCQARFAGAPSMLSETEPEFDVAFIGSRMRSRNPAGHFFWMARKRVEFVSACVKRYGKRFGLFGKGWQGCSSWQGPVPYASQQDTYRRSSVVLGGMPNAYNDFYTSDRVFIAAASGVPLVDYRVKGVGRILEDGVDWWLACSIPEMLQRADDLLELSLADRQALGQTARQRILKSHTQYHRCREMVEIVKDLTAARRSGNKAKKPVLSFLPTQEASGDDTPPIVGWHG